MPHLNLASWVECTEVEGPGRRFALWVQGCLKRCPRCCNPQMMEIVPRHVVDVDLVVQRVLASREQHGIEGITLIGGEPMLQARGLAHTARGCREAGLSVMTFTGYTLPELERLQLPGAADLLLASDIVVDGPYLWQEPETERHWAGSSNQRFHFLTNRYQPGIEHDPAYQHGAEIRIGQDGEVQLNGYPAEFGLAETALPQVPGGEEDNLDHAHG